MSARILCALGRASALYLAFVVAFLVTRVVWVAL
jgi:hypothetical protein